MLEILIVIVIIGVLGAIGYPMALKMKSRATSTVCVGKLRQIGISFNLYFADHGMRFPVMLAARESRNQDVPAIDTVLREYVNDELTFKCPADHEDIFEDTGSSYFWNSLVNGQLCNNMNLLGLTKNKMGIPIVSDKEAFHKHSGSKVNILYADGHVQNKVQFNVDPK